MAGDLLAFRVSVGLFLSATCAAQPSFQGLGDLSGGAYFSRPTALSADGTTVVGMSRSSNGDEAFRWTASTGIVGLGDFPGGGFYSFATDVSADGSVVVGSGRTTGGDTLFVWRSSSGLAPIIDGFFPVHGTAIGVGDDGSKIAAVRTDQGGPVLFTWTQQSGITPLPGSPSGASFVMSGDGRTILCGNQVWRDGVGPTFLSTNYPASYARASNRDGSTILGTGLSNAAYRWSAVSGDIQPVWLRGSEDRAEARGVSDDSQVLVGTNGTNAMYLSGPTGAVLLQEWLVAKYGLQLNGWRLRAAVGVSADGKVIMGEGINPSGAEEAWLLRLPADEEECPADFNTDGGVDFSDVEAFFERWENGC